MPLAGVSEVTSALTSLHFPGEVQVYHQLAGRCAQETLGGGQERGPGVPLPSPTFSLFLWSFYRIQDQLHVPLSLFYNRERIAQILFEILTTDEVHIEVLIGKSLSESVVVYCSVACKFLQHVLTRTPVGSAPCCSAQGLSFHGRMFLY